MAAQPKVTGVKLIRQYAHGWLWIEKRSNGQWRFRFGTIFEDGKQADFIYSAWQNPIGSDNRLLVFARLIIERFEKQYNPEPYRG